jgi:signal transduction histidine kinase
MLQSGLPIGRKGFVGLRATAAESQAAVERLGEEQAALRHVATLVAQAVAPGEIFTAVAAEVGRLFDLPWVGVMRYDSTDSFTVLATWGDHPFPPGSRWPLDGPSTFESVLRSGRASRFEDYNGVAGTVAQAARKSGILGGIGAPIVVGGTTWGVIAAPVTEERTIPEGAEIQLNLFTELVATAIANAESREALTRIADEQAALRRVATLVAGSAPPMDVFGAVSEELGRIFASDFTYVTRFDSEDAVTVLAGWMATGELPMVLPGRWTAGPTSKAIRATGAPVRLDPYPRRDEVEDPETAVVAAPITVEGELWGFLTVASTNAARPPPVGTEERLSSFAELVATAIANAESRAEVHRLAEEQAALRRVAVLVAQHPSPDEVFTAVTEAVATLLGADLAAMHVFTGDGTATTIAGWTAEGPLVPIGTKLPLDGDSAVARIFHTGAAARIDSYVDVEGETAEVARGLRLRSTVGAPIIVEGRLWGALMAATRGEEPLRQDAEGRIAAFTELVATAISNAESRAALGLLADEQAALRRVATLVAEGVPPSEVFSAVSREVSGVFPSRPDNTATVVRFDSGPECVLVGASKPVRETPLGTRWQPNDLYVSTRVLRTGASARVDESDLSVGGFAAEQMRRQGYLSQVASPIVVDGRLWGAMTVSAEETLPADTEERLEKFTELVATAIANAESRQVLDQLAEEQAALRRVATLVAQGVPPPELFSAVTTEVARVFSGVDPSLVATVIRFDPGPESVLVGGSRPYESEPIGSRWAPKDLYVSTRVLRTGGPARVDAADLESLGGPDADALRLRGFLHQVGSPVVVEGRLWGAMTLNSNEALPADVDRRLVSFTELVATAIANAESQSELAASRRRIVEASDDARRRIERDLHDGIQQQLVSLGMELGELEASLPGDGELKPKVAGVAGGLRSAVDDLREISRGIHPAILSHGGLGAALRTLARRSAVPVQLNAVVDGRLPERVEVAAYYVVSEALTNAARHARASVVSIEVVGQERALELSIRDDGVGGADPGGGTGLIGLKDRIEALGGTITVESPHGQGTSLVVTLPLGGEAGSATDD